MSGKVSNSIAALSLLLIGAGLLLVSLFGALILILAGLGLALNGNMIATVLLSMYIFAIPAVIVAGIIGFVSVRIGFTQLRPNHDPYESAQPTFTQPDLGESGRPMF